MYAHAMSEQQWRENHYSPSLKGNHAAPEASPCSCPIFFLTPCVAAPRSKPLIPPQPPSSLLPVHRSVRTRDALVDAFLLAS